MRAFDYQKWLCPTNSGNSDSKSSVVKNYNHTNFEEQLPALAVPAIPTTPYVENSKNSGNSSTVKTYGGFTTQQLQEFLGEDWNDYKDEPKVLEAWAGLLAKNKLIEQGIAPSSFTAITHCASCGDVFVPPSLTNDGQVLACMWCWNRSKGLSIPKP